MARPKARDKAKPRASAEGVSPNPYSEMLDNVTVNFAEEAEGPAVKKRRIAGRLVVQGTPVKDESDAESSASAFTASSVPIPVQQTIFNDSEDSEDSDSNWEDVDLGGSSTAIAAFNDMDDQDEAEELSLVLGGDADEKKQRSTPRKKPITGEERKLRLEIHKINILCILSHVYLRNHWCNDDEVQTALRALLPQKTLSYLRDDPSQSQFQRNRSFVDGLKQAYDIFKRSFKIDARGMARFFWAEDAEKIGDLEIPDDIDLPIEKSDFRDIARKLAASRDVGAQLFCALLRAADVEARLVCSLQALPFTAKSKGNTPVKPSPYKTMEHTETRIGIHSSTNQSKKRRLRESRYPIYWVEAFNGAYQKWIPIDPLVTDTIAKPSKFEPPANDMQNSLVYVIAFEEDGSTRDVTRRYASAYNAKTRKARIEFTKGGVKWWKQVMSIYRRPYGLDRDQVEDAELSRKEAQEPMPKNVQDFKDHPYYALERHLKRSEVIHPRIEAGKVATGKSGLDTNRIVEPIFRRRNVHVVKSADSWYRLGREIKVGEQPLKRVQPRKGKDPLFDDESSDVEENTGTAMYAGFQTCTYQAPPVVNGRIPRNEYGNLDVYVPSMIPPGGVHVIHQDASRSARVLGIDYADAVTGFDFKGRQGTAVIKGVVVAAECADAMIEVTRGFGYERKEAEQVRRSLHALKLWKRFLTFLRIKERVEEYAIEGEREDYRQTMKNFEEDENEGAGGFIPGPEQEPASLSSPRPINPNFLHTQAQFDESEDGWTMMEPQIIYGPTPRPRSPDAPIVVSPQQALDLGDNDAAGGFVVEEESGGFIPDDDIGHQPESTGILETRNQKYTGNENICQEHSLDSVDDSPLQPKNESIADQDQLTSSIIKSDSPKLKEAVVNEKPLEKMETVPDESRDEEIKDESEQSDVGSLLSHDPEDEDADPDWLE